ncbi:hypothetical protein DFQ28_003753 [Apophysomyces sp. BC1034]|nr:hypothetical protein DFQ28_003753 [Apophysomyces sp. BC1034]
MPTKRVQLESRQDQIKIEIKITDNGSYSADLTGVIIAHPYGPLGGNMQNNVVVALHKFFANRGYVTVRLNFRGCGRSEGKTSWTGMSEREDYQTVVDYLTEQYPKLSRLILCGYSYGSMIASTIRPASVSCSYLLISYPLSVMWLLATMKYSYFRAEAKKLLQDQEDCLLLFGSKDQFTGVNSYQKWFKTITSEQVDQVMIEGADHFWFHNEERLITEVDRWLERHIHSSK